MNARKNAVLLYGGIAVAVMAVLGLSSFMSIGNGERFKVLMLFVVFVTFLCGVVVIRLGVSEKYLFYLILIAGIVMRAGYSIYTFMDVRQHDVLEESLEEPGHLNYIYRLYTGSGLPDSFRGQFYHGPLSHAMISLFLRLVRLAGASPFAAEASWLQVVPCILSCFTIVIVYQIAHELGLGERTCLTAEALAAFHPTFYLLAGSVNNDMAMTFFFFVGILYTVRYRNQPTMKCILILAAAIGCAMMSKLSGGMIAFFTGAVFLEMLVSSIRRSGLPLKKLIGQFAAFLAVCVPLGLWHSFRNLIVLGQPLGYVAIPPVDCDLYVGWYGLRERFFSFPLSCYFGSWCNPEKDYNLWTYMLKSAVFGEWEYKVPQLLADSLLLPYALLAVVSAVCMCCYIRKKNVHPVLRYGLPVLMASQLVLYIYFNIICPFGCAMDFRYIVPIIVPFVIYTALAAVDMAQGTAWWNQVISSVIYSLIGGFCTLSVLFYVLL